MVHTPITALIVGGHDIDGGNGKRGQVRAALPFQDHERGRSLLTQTIQPIKGEHADPWPLKGKVLLTPTSQIVLNLSIGMKLLAVIHRGRFKRQPVHCLGLTIDTRLGLLG